MASTVRERAQRLISVIRDRAFEELARERGELAPMALTMDRTGRIGMIAVYTGDTYPDPDNHLADLIATVKAQAALHELESTATAHYEQVVLAPHAPPLDAVCVQFETRRAAPLRVYFPYTIKKKLSGPSELTPLEPVTTAGTHAVFARGARSGSGTAPAAGSERTRADEKE
jgi:hypothetical protein